MKFKVTRKYFKGLMEAHNVAGARSTSKNFGKVIGGKGGDTTNFEITDDLEEREARDYTKGKLPFEHERYLGEAMVITKQPHIGSKRD